VRLIVQQDKFINITFIYHEQENGISFHFSPLSGPFSPKKNKKTIMNEQEFQMSPRKNKKNTALTSFTAMNVF